MIAVRDLSVRRDGRVICVVPALEVERGAHAVVLGGNGSGKTTLLRVLAGLEHAAAGSVSVGARGADAVFVHQAPYLLRGTVLDNVAYGLTARGERRAQARERAAAMLERVGIGELAGRTRRRLSGGEVRRVAVARAAVLEPVLLLLDEPFAELDDAGAAAVARMLTGLSRTTVVTTSPVELPPEAGTVAVRLSRASA